MTPAHQANNEHVLHRGSSGCQRFPLRRQEDACEPSLIGPSLVTTMSLRVWVVSKFAPASAVGQMRGHQPKTLAIMTQITQR